MNSMIGKIEIELPELLLVCYLLEHSAIENMKNLSQPRS